MKTRLLIISLFTVIAACTSIFVAQAANILLKKGVVLVRETMSDGSQIERPASATIKYRVANHELETTESKTDGSFVLQCRDSIFYLHSVMVKTSDDSEEAGAGYVIADEKMLSTSHKVSDDTLLLVMESISSKAARINNNQKALYQFLNLKFKEDTIALFQSVVSNDIRKTELHKLYQIRNFRERVLKDEDTPPFDYLKDDSLRISTWLSMQQDSSSLFALVQNSSLLPFLLTHPIPSISQTVTPLTLKRLKEIFNINILTSRCLMGLYNKEKLEAHFNIIKNISETISKLAARLSQRDTYEPKALNYYKEYANNLLENNLDEAEKSIIERAKLDSTDVQRNLDAGKFLMWRDKIDEATKYYHLAEQFNKNSQTFETIYKELGDAYMSMLNYGNAEHYYRMADSVISEHKDFTHIDCIKNRVKLNNALVSMGVSLDTLTRAESTLLQANSALENNYTSDYKIRSQMNNNLGVILEKKAVKSGDLEEKLKDAEDYYLKAKKILRSYLYYNADYKNDLDIAIYDINLASCQERQNKYKSSLANYQEADEIYLNVYGYSLYWTQANVGILQNNIALTYISMGKYETAIKYFMRALKIMRNIYPDNNHPITRTILENIAQVAEKMDESKLNIED